MIILGIETSCDETAVAVLDCKNNNIKILSNIVSSQIEIHQKYGGVVPEVAAREHILNILPVVNEALEKAEISPANHSLLKKNKKNKIDAIAVTAGPGLITSLIIGVETAKTLAYAWQIPIIGINHIEGHICANFINQEIKKSRNQEKIEFPALILTVSGGHTLLILMKEHENYKIIGETRDDAVGEAFDKAAKLLNIGYPGGPAIAAEAARVKSQKSKVESICLPRPMLNDKSFDFSFSGLKTALLYAIQKDKNWKEKIPEYCEEFQQAVIDVLITKTIKAAQKLNCKTIMLSGGVSANKELRSQFDVAIKTKLINTKLVAPEFEYCTDNAAMIATAGYFYAKRKDFTPWQKIKADCNKEF
ncbi:MAG: tRNA (adenosine(37)-N6)-threonylcarbamoyltransferase complex transferase subunit TsaD [Patescibacteria group bacterium]|nr:tRNA (adenosine(37)-N6)-threonylcarbamoyltransferase complex transferase subunit TsaD [Patescibacteria group bacterium]MBU0879198.1 tRNA (adenosine(37)-N6)-threonylcarbamoyltransferase complex transferase subunit TsaD [Patescibacteria group bacterium]MBU0880220.1 tRNA (adenosine(37)-N6)-threonylcarbamoyltransferase complex transferase subunit TsaD [Patescibacteria group bacterium]MBU1062969.1 tRNA (adenosine(37)-N6)-threonylcarbamoyltransferase complex transferase subunit TsaD [Patescibacteri